ncbi:hom [Symbiodinium natans]|uniref:Homoserine dehydrogenase n=1 Tax=Symbiodinium natans TaxID=878477 RepID=A0A812IG15_9DINO|nr:hom [Symbiodinium natans]
MKVLPVLGETPFIALVPRGLRWTNAGGGGFYLGSQSFNEIDPGLRADLQVDRDGKLMMYGHVELVAPFLLRGQRRTAASAEEDLEFRLFCSRKNRIIGCIGEPLRVQVIHQVVPPPLATLQVCCDGHRATLRWAGFELEEKIPVDVIHLRVKTDRRDEILDVSPEATQYELNELLPDTDYEFYLRLQSHAGAGDSISCSCRTNARCSPPLGLSRAGASTTYVDLQWKPPQVLGNERTGDRWQLQAEEVRSYEAQLSIADDSPSPRSRSLSKSRTSAAADLSLDKSDLCRRCRWEMGSLQSKSSEHLTGRLGGLRPDTLYSLEMFCAVNSMGAGTAARELQFWTMPLHPRATRQIAELCQFVIQRNFGFGGLVVLTLREAFLRLLQCKEDELLSRYGLRVIVVGIATHSRGVVASPDGLDLDACLASPSLAGLGTELEDAKALLQHLSGHCDAVLEAINASHRDGQPALDLLEAALRLTPPAHAITASKPPVAFGYRRLSQLASQNQRRFLFESSVMDGVPVFSLLRQLPGACVRRISGILNSTTNLILTRMQSEGCTLEEAVEFAQDQGIAERDPSDDLDGKDAAVKLCCLSAVAFRRDVDPAQIPTASIRGITLAEIRDAASRGLAVKVVCEAELVDGEVKASVSLRHLPLTSAIGCLQGASSAVTLETDVLAPVTVTSTDPTTMDTAYGLLQDLLTAVLVKLEGGEEKSFLMEEEKLRRFADEMPELPLQFKEMPDSSSSDAEHFVKLRARNPGGWSTWSEEVVTSSIARQQGADNAQRALEQAMARRVPENLMKVLKDVRDIEFDDKTLVSEATELLETLQAVQTKVGEAMVSRDPENLQRVLAEAQKVSLPGLEKAQALLDHLQRVCKNLDTAKGIDALRAALRDGHEARLPAPILQRAVQRLGTREAAQQGLEMAMEAARVPVLRAALDTAKDMHLPSEDAALSLLKAISHSENLLQASLISRDIRDLERALDSSDKSGLREDELIMRAQKLLARQIELRDDASARLAASMEARFPEELQAALETASVSQVDQQSIVEGTHLLRQLEQLLADIEAGNTAK